jgi:D-lactate dehydrogenase (cytochrome)
MEASLKFNSLDPTHIKNLQSLVATDRFSTGESVLDLHAKDQSQHPPRRPEAVIWPVDASEVSEIVKYANDHLIPVTGWGSGSSLEGNPIPVQKGIVLDFSQMNHILNIRTEDFQADVEPGVIYQDLNEKLRHTGLFFPPDPGARATVGGMIANNASGTRTYDLIHLIVGSEGTLGVVVGATLRLVGFPAEYSAAIATFPSVEAASKAVFEIIRSGLNPAALELIGPECIELMNQEEQLGLNVSPTLFVEFHSSTASHLEEVLEMAQEIFAEKGCTAFRPGLGKAERDRIFKARHALGEMSIRKHPDCGTLVVDVAVPNTAYPEMIATIGEELAATHLTGYTFGHAGDGNIHLNIPGKKGDKREWELIHQTVQRLVSKALGLGGTATGEHGVGLGKKRYMPAEHGKSLEWMKRVKALFDPNGILNPGKIFP